MAEETEALPGRPWLRAWLVVGLAAWAQVGVLLVSWAGNQGLVEDISFSPYHLVGYAALLTLAAYVLWAFFRGLRRGDWRHAFPAFYGGLGIAFVLLVAWVLIDMIWRSTLGINFGIESGLAPPRLLIPTALALLAVGPVREAIADRARPGLSPGERRVRWAGVVGAGLIGGALTLSAFNPVGGPLNDYAVNPGVDATEIWTMAADGSGQTRLLPALGDGTDYSLPAWSPDGDRIAYTTWTNKDGVPQNIRNEDQAAAIWSMAADGSDPRQVISEASAHLWVPAWSPDGRWIAYTRSPVGVQPASNAAPEANPAPGQIGPPTTTAGGSIWIVHPDGSGAVRLTPDGVDAVGGTWSPNAAQIAYIVAGAGGNSDIHVADINVGAPGATPAGAPALRNDRTVATDPANDWGPSWSPDGKRIAFNSDRAGYVSIWVGAADSSSLEELRVETQPGPTGFADWVPVFSPDGARIAFTSDRTGEAEIWSMAADGSDLRNLTNHPEHYDGQWSVAWSPDGSRLAYATGSFQDAANSGWVREDLAVAQVILFGLALAVIGLLIAALGAPLGSFTVALTIIVALSAFPADQWRFLPAAVVAGLLTDGLVRSVRLRHRARVAAAALPAFATLALGLTIGIGGTLEWSLTLLLGVTVVSALLGWALAEAVERLLPRPVEPSEAPAG